MSLLRKGATLEEKIKVLNSLTERLKNLDTAEKIKGTVFERWGIYWKGLYKDYKDVAVDVVTECRDRPIKSAIYVLGLASGYFFAKNNPDELSYREELLKNEMKLMQVGESTRNPVSVEYLSHMSDCLNTDVTRRVSLGIFSLIWIDDASNKCANYKYTCSYMKPKYTSFYKRIVDIGFMNKWWVLENKMNDYDVNESEFRK